MHVSFGDGSTWLPRYGTNASGEWVFENVDVVAGTLVTSIAVDPEDNPHVAYGVGDSDVAQLWYAIRIDGEWDVQLVDPDDGGWSIHLDVDPSGAAHVVYATLGVGGVPQDVRYATNSSGGWAIEPMCPA